MANRPAPFNGLRHLALVVPNLEECERFYTEIIGMQILRRASPNLVYLTLGNDNLSLGRSRKGERTGVQYLDHFGFIVDTLDQLQEWYEFMLEAGVNVLDTPHDHGDGARSFHCTDPAGNVIQPIYHPAISGQRFSSPGQ